MTASKRRRSELENLAWGLTDRDWAVLDDLGGVRLLTARHIQRLHVYEDSPLTQARRTRSILQRLFDIGVVSRLDRRVGGLRAGSSGFTYALSTTGQRLVTGHGPSGGQRLRRPWEPSAAFIDHILAVSELYVELRELARSDDTIELLDFRAEPAAWRRFSGPMGETLLLKPDAMVIVGTPEQEHLTFVELDRSTESLRVIRRKALTYIDYWRTGNEQLAEGTFPKVLFVVPDAHRKEGVVGALAQLEPEAWQLFQVVLNSQAVAAVTGRLPPNDDVKHYQEAM